MNERLVSLGEVLSEGTPAAAHALRDLVGGQIVVTEIRQPDRQRHYLQGRFTIRAAAVAQALVGASNDVRAAGPAEAGAAGEEIIIDFRPPAQYEAESERAKELLDKGWLMVRIGEAMGKKKSYVRRLIEHWFTSHGLPVPDGRSRRSTLEQKHRVPPTFEALADSVLTLLHEGLLIEEIAARLDVCRDTITKVMKYLRTVRGLNIPDGRTRRKSLDHKVSRPSGSDAPRDDNPPAT